MSERRSNPHSYSMNAVWSSSVALALLTCACATIPEPKFERFSFPKNAHVQTVQRPYTVLGPVRSKVDYTSLDAAHDEKALCKNYYNRSVRELLKYAHKQGADAVINVESVVFLEDGRREVYKTPECSDDGGEGQILTQGVAVKWKETGAESGAWEVPNATPSPVVVMKQVTPPEPLEPEENDLLPARPAHEEALEPIRPPKAPTVAERTEEQAAPVVPPMRGSFADPRRVPGF